MKALFLITLLSVGAASALHAPATARAEEPRPASATLKLEVLGMVTPNCPVLVKKAVGAIDGVEKVEASLEKHSATVTYRPDRTSPEQIRRVIKDRVGFDTRVKG